MLFKLSLLILAAIVLQVVFVQAKWPLFEAYTFDELVEKNLVYPFAKPQKGKEFANSNDEKLKYDYDFSLGDDEKIEAHGLDSDWVEKMADARNAIKEARQRQRDMYKKIVDLTQSKENDQEMEALKAKMDEEDEIVAQYIALCGDLDREKEKRLNEGSDSNDDWFDNIVGSESNGYASM